MIDASTRRTMDINIYILSDIVTEYICLYLVYMSLL